MVGTNRGTLFIPGVYMTFGAAWVFFSNRWLFANVESGGRLRFLGTWTDWIYVSISTVVLYLLIRAFNRRSQRENKKYHAIFEGADDAILLADEKGYFECNSAAEKMFGIPRAEILNRKPGQLAKLVNPDGSLSDHTMADLLESVMNGSPQRYESRLACVDGRVLDIDVNLAPLFLEGSKTAMLIMRDVTAMKRAAEQTGLSEMRFRAIFENARDAIFIIDEKGVYVDCNPAALDLFVCDKEELLKRTPRFFSPEMQPDGRVSSEKAKALLGLALRGEPQRFEWRHRRTDGTEFDADVTLSRFRFHGRVMLQAIVMDISDRKKAVELEKKSEDQLSVFFEHQLVGMSMMSPDKGWLRVNNKMCSMFGYCRDELESLTWEEFTHPDDLQISLDRYNRLLAGDIDSYVLDKRYLRKDGSVISTTVSVGCVRREDGFPDYVMVLYEDETERKKLEAQLIQAQKMEAVGQLAGGVAHDFNNILTAIIGYSHLLLMKMPEDDPSKVFAEQIRVSADRAAELTNSLLAFSRKQVMVPESVDLNKVVGQLEKMLRRLIRENIGLRLEPEGEMLTVLVDRGKMEQVIMNLVTNAADAMPNGGNITISTCRLNMGSVIDHSHSRWKPGSYACIAVSDTGCGMDHETRRKIFEPFFTTKEIGKGTGLGLSIVYGIINQHGGHINVYSEQGRGTTFRIYLPLAEGGEKCGTAEEARKAPVGGSETILLAEDDAMVADFHRTLLETAGYTVVTAVDGEDALTRFVDYETGIDLLVFDVIMPRMNGKHACNIIRKAAPEVKILFLSGYPAEVLGDVGVAPDRESFMSKPVDPDDLLVRIRELLDRTSY